MASMPDYKIAFPAELKQLRPFAEQGLLLEDRIRTFAKDFALQLNPEVCSSPVIMNLQSTYEAWVADLSKQLT